MRGDGSTARMFCDAFVLVGLVRPSLCRFLHGGSLRVQLAKNVLSSVVPSRA